MKKILLIVFFLMLGGGVLAVAGGVYVLHYYSQDLPNYEQLGDYKPPIVTRVHAGDGRLLGEFATEKRVFVPMEAIPKLVIKAFLAAEDKTFYQHSGIDVPGVIKAAVTNLSRVGSNRRPVGASTITQQVAKNFLLGNEVSVARKVKEAILAFRIERTFSKDKILELYLNQIYLGGGSYGVAAAALNYFNRSLDELTIAEAAFLAGLPKAPNSYHPQRYPSAAKVRRDYVIGRMLEDGWITQAEADDAQSHPVVMRPRDEVELARADYFVEEVRRDMMGRFGDKGVYGGGLSVRTTLDPTMQLVADRVLRAGLIDYDRRHGYRGGITHADPKGPLQAAFAKVVIPDTFPGWRKAIVVSVDAAAAVIKLEDGLTGEIPLAELKWARSWVEDQKVGPQVQKASDVLEAGEVIVVEEVESGGRNVFALRQLPEIAGALLALDPHTGRVLAMAGGLSYALSQYNRATQAARQPGSALKPFVYLAALEQGFTPSSLVLDAPFVIDQGPGLGKWKPVNYSGEFYGPSPLRVGIEKSRNLMTVRLAQHIGMEAVANTVERFGITDNLPRLLSMSLGAGETTLLRLTTAYAMLVNGGKQITPTLIDRIQDRTGKTIFKHDLRDCERCAAPAWNSESPPRVPDTRKQIAEPTVAYQIVSMLQGVVDRGTGRRIASLGIPLGGKTGTTNDSTDAWFVGFAPDLAVGVYIGFDTPRTLGKGETGASAAVPVFQNFMGTVLKNKPATPFRVPPGIRLVRVNPETGALARPGDKGSILEAFRPGTEPTSTRSVLDGSEEVDNDADDESEDEDSVSGEEAPAPVASPTVASPTVASPAPAPSASPPQSASPAPPRERPARDRASRDLY
jgi:penicillin-binding protein 1A